MPVEIAPLTMKPPRLVGLTQRLLENHYENHYGGAIQRLNAIDTRLQARSWPGAPACEVLDLKREQLATAGSVVLHEVYFDSLGGSGGAPMCPDLVRALEHDFGSVQRWRSEFVAMANAIGCEGGWVVLAWSARLGRLMNHFAVDHTQVLAAADPILALDLYEHAYCLDFASDVRAYIDAFMRNIDWEHVADRLRVATGAPSRRAAPHPGAMTVSQLYRSRQHSSDAEPAPLVLDVRLPEDRLRDALPGAPWRDLHKVDEWCGQLPRDRKIVVYCMYGFWVSQDTAAALCERGYDAYILEGGICAWRGMGYPAEPL